ncbi:hypothetical protein [Escherichia coli ISC41]|nr:hypothetical protein [Escherichia coli ISC41]
MPDKAFAPHPATCLYAVASSSAKRVSASATMASSSLNISS